jgi:hypothetical protein
LAQGFAELIHNVYIGLFALAVILALWLPKTGKGKVGSAILAAAVMSIPMVIGLKHQAERREQAAKEQVVVDRARTRFDELCRDAGYKINRTVDDVDAVMLLKVRPKLEFKDSADPMLPGAAMAGEQFGDAYIESFLGVESHDRGYARGGRGSIGGIGEAPLPRYRYVEAVDPNDGQRYRYTSVRNVRELTSATGVAFKVYRSELKRELANGVPPRYAVDYEDIVNIDDRKLWIAGTTIRVVDQRSGEVLAEYTTYLMDGGMGVTDGTRAPWVHASHSRFQCPEIDGATSTHTRYFVDRVLRPAKGVLE